MGVNNHRITHASLFSGIGGPEVAAAMLGWHNVFHCEINPFGRKVLEYWFPESVSYEDITKTNFKEWRGKIDILTGGFPCQPFSYAGSRGGQKDERYLWPEMCRAIQEIRPTWVVGENVAGITTMVEGGVLSEVGNATSLFQESDIVHGYELEQSFTIERICRDLERIGYSVQSMLIPAAAVGAPHRRDRIFILAYDADSNGSNDLRIARKDEGESKEERLSERHKVRIVGESVDVRQETESSFTNTNGRRGREIQTSIHSRLSDGNEPISDGGKWDVTDSDGKRLQRRGRSRLQEDEGRNRGTKDNRRSSGITGIFTHSLSEGLEGQDESGSSEGGEWVHLRRNTPRYDWATDRGLIPEERWREFPTIAPVHRGNDGLQMPMDDIAVREAGNSMDRDSVIIGALKSGNIEVDFTEGKIYSSRIRGHEGERIELSGSECNGYIVHTLSFNGVKKQVRAHQVVWIAANGLYDKKKYQIDHINRDRKDNRLCNLHLVTAAENIQNSDRSSRQILCEEDKMKIYQLFHEGNMSMREIARDFGVSKSLVFNVIHEFPDLSISFSKWRTETLKAYGNAIVPQVMYRIFQAIEQQYGT